MSALAAWTAMLRGSWPCSSTSVCDAPLFRNRHTWLNISRRGDEIHAAVSGKSNAVCTHMKIQQPPGGHSTQRSQLPTQTHHPTKLVYQNPGLNRKPLVWREMSYFSTIRSTGSHSVSHPVCPRSVAWCRGPLPLMSLWFTSAPFCSRNSQAIKEPWQKHRKLSSEFSFALHWRWRGSLTV